jgi:PST family polysaccharide transporter
VPSRSVLGEFSKAGVLMNTVSPTSACVPDSESAKNQPAFVSPSIGLKAASARGGLVTVFAQLLKLFCTLASTMVLSRLLAPADFGLVAMATAVTGVLMIFKDGGLSMVTLQRENITLGQVSTLFWVNLALGIVLAGVSVALALPMAAWYREPRLVWITLVLSGTFILGAATVQHEALLRRQMRYRALAVVEVISMAVGAAVGISMAWFGCGYWALVGVLLASGLASLVTILIALPWRPDRPRRDRETRSLLHFGGMVTGSDFLNYLFRNADNVLIGWYWGAFPLGLYAKAYSLLMLAPKQINTPVAGVAISTLSRLQQDPPRFRRYFLGGYSLVASINLPLIIGLSIFADDVVRMVLGSQWDQAVPLFRLLVPAAVTGSLLNPFGWLFIATGHPERQVRFGVWWCVLLLGAFVVGLPHGPAGVAAAYSIMSCLLTLPLCFYAIRGTAIRPLDLLRAIWPPLVGVLAATVVAVVFRAALPADISFVLRGLGGCLLVAVIYAFVLLVVMRQWSFYKDIVLQILPARAGGRVGSSA